MKKRVSLLICAALVLAVLTWNLSVSTGAEQVLKPFVTTAATTAEEVLAAWDSGDYSYVKLGADLELTLNGQNLVVDLAGYDLSVAGNGTLSGMDSANNTYDHLACGVVTAGEGIHCETEFVSADGVRYVALQEGSYATFHRLDMEIKTVTLRTSAAGLYYKAQYQCDRQLEEKVVSYGIVVSLQDVPGADFKTAEGDAYTVSSEKFVSGATVTSGSIVGIMKSDLSASENLKRMRMPIYTNAYIDFGNGPVLADTVNAGTKNGTSASLYRVLFALDNNYDSLTATVQGQLEDFCGFWKSTGLDFGMTKLGKVKTAIDNSNLKFDTGTTNAWCPVCEKKVTWTALKAEETTSANGGHYYLVQDLTYTGTGDYFFRAPTTGGHTACLHLNGHNMTATKTRAIYGSSGELNVMGNGNVTGYNKKSTYGAAVMVNNKNAKSRINLYGGTYLKVSDAGSSWPVIAMGDAGGNFYFYKDVVVGNGSGTAVKIGENSNKDNNVSFQGCTINGAVTLSEPSSANKAYKTKLELLDCTVNGVVTIPSRHEMTVSGKVYIKRLDAKEDTRIIVKSLDSGSSITVYAEGTFTTASAGISQYASYFKAYAKGYQIKVKNNALQCGKDYTSDLSFVVGTTDAWCPSCRETVTWTALSDAEAVALTLNGHYYLSEDLTYTGGGDYFLKAPGGADKTCCVHLNGHNITATNTKAIYGGSCILNVMGTGVVSGRKGSSVGTGSTVQVNTSNASGTINLFSGTYLQSTGATSSEYTVNAHTAGGTINIYENAIVKGNLSGKAIQLHNPTSNNIYVGVYGASVEGDIVLQGETTEYTATLVLDGAKVNGTVDVNGTNTVKIAHNTQINLLDADSATKITLDRLIDGADITVYNPGTFTLADEDAGKFVKYFHPMTINDSILVRDDMLVYKANYTAKLLPDADGYAYCPACRANVQWKAVETDSQIVTFTNGGHWYLNRDMIYTGTEDVYIRSGNSGTVACLHLNNHNITATKVPALFVSSGYLNVMGDGIVTGYNATSGRGAAVFTNNKNANNGISLYSGTYTKGNSTAGAAVIAMHTIGGTVKVYEDALIDAGGNGNALYTGSASSRISEFYLYGGTIRGNVSIPASTLGTTFISDNGTIIGTVTVTGTPTLSFSGRTQISKLILPVGVIADFSDMLEGSSINISADGVFSTAMENADEWVQYFTTADVGDWVIVRDKTFYQGVKTGLTTATETDIQALLEAYGDRVVRYGELHNHSNSGSRADGYNTIEEIKEEMLRLGIDFYTIVDHRQSGHMYDADWDDTMFIGGTETASKISDLEDGRNAPHYNLVFSDVSKLEKFVADFPEFFYYAETPAVGTTFNLDPMTLARLREMGETIREYGGMLINVHPKFEGYVDYDDPLVYYYGEYTAIEIMTTTSSGHDSSYVCNKAGYDLWVDLLELGKKVYATYGNDNHKLPNVDSLTTVYTSEKDADEYMQRIMDGDMAPGWVGIRMQVGDVLMGGTTDFEGQRLVISAGEMFSGKYISSHKYAIQLYDDGGILFESELDPSEMNYYAMDADPEAKFYRVVIYDKTTGAHVAVGNPIWNG